MRLRSCLLAATVAAAGLAVPAAAAAAPHVDRGLTIGAAPNPIIAGDDVIVYGRLTGADAAGQTIRLFHRVVPAEGFTQVAETTTDSDGFYEFIRAEGVVQSNRFWYVRGPGATHSRTILERVAALVSLNVSATSTDTAHALTFTGEVSPSHPGQWVVVQQRLEGDRGWSDLGTARLSAGSTYAFTHTFRTPAVRDVRVVFPGDRRNLRGESDAVTVTVQQAQVPGFNIATSASVIAYGQSATITGTLDRPGTTAPDPGASVTLWGRASSGGHFVPLAASTTDSSGGYAFTVAPTRNEVLFVRMTLDPKLDTARILESVQDVISLSAAQSSGAQGASVTLSGSVLPDKSGESVVLQRLGRDGAYHSIAEARLDRSSRFSFAPTLSSAGSETFRARIYGDGVNAGAASAPVTVTVTGNQPAASLPPSS